MATKRRTLLAALASGSVGGLAGCSALGLGNTENPCSDADCDIGMSRTEFLPDEYDVSVGDTVVWRNTSDAGHTVTAYEDAIPEDAAYFASGGYESEDDAWDAWDDSAGGLFHNGETFSHTFEVPGTYDYVCIPHKPGMSGRIVVTE